MERLVPNPPDLVAPVQGAPVRGDAAKLVWKRVEGATAYQVQVAADEAFTQRIVDTRLGDVNALVVERLLHGGEGTVFWRVAAIGPGGRGAFSEAAEFVSSPAPAEGPHAGLTAEAGAETGTGGTRHDPSPVQRLRTGHAGFGVLVIGLLLSGVAIVTAFVAFPGLTDESPRMARDSVARVLRMEQDEMNAGLERYRADSAGYAIPIDSAIARLAPRPDTTLPGTFGTERD